MESAQQHRNFPARDHEMSTEFAVMRGSSGGSVISTVGLEQDLSSVRVSLDGEDDGEVENGYSTNIHFDKDKINRGGERQRRRVSAPI